MDEAWFSGLADELGQAIVDAGECAGACERLLETAHGRLDREREYALFAAIVAPTSISRILVDLIDRPPGIVLAAAHVCRETSLQAVVEVERLALPLETGAAIGALVAVAESCRCLLESADLL
ncbi:MAG TPA: hypothetical protein VE088_06525 [Gaiellaceae bacterium]|jgi:hypothetical protein|nr:hypothetical protein [Gaiellaceae bacterium]